jgi:hypothetical protein
MMLIEEILITEIQIKIMHLLDIMALEMVMKVDGVEILIDKEQIIIGINVQMVVIGANAIIMVITTLDGVEQQVPLIPYRLV